MRFPRTILFLLAPALLTVASAAQLRQVAIVDIPGQPGFDTMVWAAGKLVIAHPATNTLDVFDPLKRRVVAQVKDLASPRGLAVDEKNGRVYVANADGNALAVISTKGWRVESTIPLKESPETLLLVPELGRLYVGNWRALSITSLLLDDPDNAVTVEVGGRPEHMVYDPLSKLVFANVQDLAEVVALDPGHRVARRYKLAASQPTGIALDESGRRLFVAVRYAVLVLNADSGAELRRIAAAAGTDDLWFDAGKGTLYAATGAGAVQMISFGGDQWKTEHELQTRVRGHTLAVDPEKKMVYMPGGFEGRSKLVILKRVETDAARANAPAVAGEPQRFALPQAFPTPPKPEPKSEDQTPETAKVN